MTHDESLQARLRSLADDEPLPALDDVTRRRVERAAMAERRRTISRVRGASFAAALAAASVLGWLSLNRAPAPVARRGLDAPLEHVAPPEASPSAPAFVAAAEACQEQAGWTEAALGQQTLDLKERALLVAGSDALVQGGLSPTCDVAVKLQRGRVAVHARQLGGHGLSVNTALGTVSVRGTIFEVSVVPERGELRVRVDEGAVTVTLASGQSMLLLAGQALEWRGQAPELGGVSLGLRNDVRRALGLPPRSSLKGSSKAPPTESDEPSAESPQVRVWQEGAVSVPHIAPEPGSSVTDDGRPMVKPKLIREGEEP